MTRQQGSGWERAAESFLRKQGLKTVHKNFHGRFGEIDLVMSDTDTVCFVEVRFRKSLNFGGASASITAAKQRRIVKTALFYLGVNKSLLNRPLRFDVLLIQQQADGRFDFDWIKNAFYAE